jgi:hypothetical protein
MAWRPATLWGLGAEDNAKNDANRLNSGFLARTMPA